MKFGNKLIYWNRKTSKEEIEEVYGDDFLKWLYSTSIGQNLVDLQRPKKVISKIYGAYQSSALSAYKIESFIKKFQIPMGEFEEGPFKSFNDFFIRKFRPGARAFVQSSSILPAFAEARYFAFDKISPDQTFPIKGSALSCADLLGSAEKARQFQGGPLLLARLCPTDYHRFHFPDFGEIEDSYSIHGDLHSVNPLALKYKEDILITNERQITFLETDHFGKLAYIEVGALCVGKIIQTHSGIGSKFSRGQEKGYFLFGGSTVILLGQPGFWIPDSELLHQTSLGRETLVRLGDGLGRSLVGGGG